MIKKLQILIHILFLLSCDSIAFGSAIGPLIEYQKLQQKYEQLEAHSLDVYSQLELLEQTLETERSKNRQLNEEKLELASKLASSNSALKSDKQRQETMFEARIARMKELYEAKVNDAGARNEVLYQQLNLEASNKSKLQAQLSDVLLALQEAQAQTERLSKEKDLSIARAELKQKESEELHSMLILYEQNIEGYETKTIKLAAKNIDNKKVISEYQRNFKLMQERLSETEQHLQARVTENAKLAASLSEVAKQNFVIQEQIAAQAELARVQSFKPSDSRRSSKANLMSSQLQEKLNLAEERAKEAEAKLLSLNAEVMLLKDKVKLVETPQHQPGDEVISLLETRKIDLVEAVSIAHPEVEVAASSGNKEVEGLTAHENTIGVERSLELQIHPDAIAEREEEKIIVLEDERKLGEEQDLKIGTPGVIEDLGALNNAEKDFEVQSKGHEENSGIKTFALDQESENSEDHASILDEQRLENKKMEGHVQEEEASAQLITVQHKIQDLDAKKIPGSLEDKPHLGNEVEEVSESNDLASRNLEEQAAELKKALAAKTEELEMLVALMRNSKENKEEAKDTSSQNHTQELEVTNTKDVNNEIGLNNAVEEVQILSSNPKESEKKEEKDTSSHNHDHAAKHFAHSHHLTHNMLHHVSQSSAIVKSHMDALVTSEGLEGLSAGEDYIEKRVWLKGFGSTTKKEKRGAVPASKSYQRGMIIGADVRLMDDQLIVGLAYTKGFWKSKLRGNLAGDKQKVETNLASLYSRYRLDNNTFIGAQVGVGKATISDLHNSGSTQTKGNIFNTSLDLGYVMPMANSILFMPKVELAYNWLKIDAFNEYRDGVQYSSVGTKKAARLSARLNLTLKKKYKFTDLNFVPAMHLSIDHIIKNKVDSVQVIIKKQGEDSSIAINSPSSYKNSYVIGGSLSMYKNDMIKITVGYDYGFKADSKSHSGYGRVTLQF